MATDKKNKKRPSDKSSKSLKEKGKKKDADDKAKKMKKQTKKNAGPKKNKVKQKDLPGTLQRSPAKAQRTYAETLESANETYDGDPEASHRVAFSALKHSFEKVGDHWEPKAEKGPSDPQAAKSGQEAIDSRTPTARGRDVGTTKAQLMQEARRLDVRGRSMMNKDDLTRAVAKASR